MSEGLPADFYRYFVEHFSVMIEERAEVDPNASLLEGCVDGVDIVEDVVGRIHEETADQSIEFFRFFIVDLAELPSDDGQIGILSDVFDEGFIGNGHASEDVLLIVVVGHGVDEGIDGEFVGFLRAVEQVVGGEQHEVGDFVAFHPEPRAQQFHHQSSQPTSWHQHEIILFQIFLAFFDQDHVILLLQTFAAPLAVALLQSGLDFGAIIGCRLRIGCEILLELDVVAVIEDLIEKLLVMFDGVFHHHGFAFLVGAVEGVGVGRAEQ